MIPLSVIVPVFNAENTLLKCIESILNQTFENFELICINDGSTDSSIEILENLRRKDKRIRIISKSNGGLSSARNAGLEVADGKYVGFVDSDDFIEPEMFHVLVNLMEEDQCSLSCVGTNLIDESYNRSSEKDYHRFETRLCRQELVQPGIFNKINKHVWNKLFINSIIKQYKLKFPEGLWYEDLPFLFSYLSVSHSLSCSDKKLYNYVRSDKTIMGLTSFGNHPKILDHIRIIYPIIAFVKTHSSRKLEQDLIDVIIDAILTSNHYLNFRLKKLLFFEVVKLIVNLDSHIRTKVLKRFVSRAFLKLERLMFR